MGVGPISNSQAANANQLNSITNNASQGDFQMPDTGTGDMRYYLELQQKIEAESRAYQTMSNLLASRHEASMAAIRNMKG